MPDKRYLPFPFPQISWCGRIKHMSARFGIDFVLKCPVVRRKFDNCDDGTRFPVPEPSKSFVCGGNKPMTAFDIAFGLFICALSIFAMWELP